VLKKSSFLFSLLVFFSSYAQDRPISVMPYPDQVEVADEKFRLDKYFSIRIAGNPNIRLYSYASRILRRIDEKAGLFIHQGYITPETNPDEGTLTITVERPGEVRLHEDESYSISIEAQNLEISAVTDIGAMRGLETLYQLLDADVEGYFFPVLEIKDAPRFPWRGLLIDVARHFQPMEVLKRNLDGMAAVKMNVFHWHLTEDQGFRVESRTFPKLHEKGSDGYYYTQEQIREIIEYAEDRGIRVMPEFDIPGHATSWLVAYPQYASANGPYEIERWFGIFDPTFDPTKEETYQFLGTFLTEMAELFPDEYVHIGGDENSGKQWDANPHIQAFMKKNNIPDNHALQAYFNRRILKILADNDKKMVGWDEILQPEMPKSIVIQSWRGKESFFEAAENGYQAILSNGYYIDLMRPAKHHYLNDPVPPGSKISENAEKNIFGGEATMWSEHVTAETIDSRIWPRTAAIAERLWSPQDLRDIEDMYARLEDVSLKLEALGLTHIKNRDMILRRLSGSRDIEALKTLVEVIEPVKGYKRNPAADDPNVGALYNVFSPYTLIADAATADAKGARDFNNLVNNYLKTNEGELAEKIKKRLQRWKNNHHTIRERIKEAPALREIESLSRNLSLIAEIGLQAVDYIEKKEKAPSSWKNKSLSVVEKAKEPGGKTEIMIVDAIEKLVKAAS